MYELTQQDMALASGGVAPIVILGAWVLAGTAVGVGIQAYLSNETQDTQCSQ